MLVTTVMPTWLTGDMALRGHHTRHRIIKIQYLLTYLHKSVYVRQIKGVGVNLHCHIVKKGKGEMGKRKELQAGAVGRPLTKRNRKTKWANKHTCLVLMRP